MGCCQRHDLIALAYEERIIADNEPFDPLLDQGRKSYFEVALGRGLQDNEFEVSRARCRFDALGIVIDGWIIRINENGPQVKLDKLDALLKRTSTSRRTPRCLPTCCRYRTTVVIRHLN